MVVFKTETVEGPKNIYMDGKLYRSLTEKVAPNVKTKDKDSVFIVDGSEGGGKSVFTMQMAKVLDPTFDLSRVCMTPDEFTRAILKAKKGQCVIFDEAFTGLSSRSSLTEINRIIVSLMMEMRQRNLFVFIVMPTFFMLDKYVTLWRSKGLFHVYTSHGKRGRWCYFNNRKKKLLYLKGKKLYSYGWPKSRMHGVFKEQYIVNEEEYRQKKANALKKKVRATKSAVYLEQRNVLLWILNKELGDRASGISEMLKKYGLSLTKAMINIILRAKREELKDISEIETEEPMLKEAEKPQENAIIEEPMPDTDKTMPEIDDLEQEGSDNEDSDDFDG